MIGFASKSRRRPRPREQRSALSNLAAALAALPPVLLPLLCLLACIPPAAADLPYPLLGHTAAGSTRGGLPDIAPGGVVNVTVSALLERVTALNVRENTYEAVWWVVLDWNDPRAPAAVESTTGAMILAASHQVSEISCLRPCENNALPVSGCCDGVWLPHVEMPNLLSYSDTQAVRYRIAVQPDGGVTWSTRIIGTWYAPFDFRAYPFDHQHMLMELAIADSEAQAVGLRWGHVAKLNNTAHTKGSDLSGWNVKWAKGKVYDSRKCHIKRNFTVPSYTLPEDQTSNASAMYVPVGVGQRNYPTDLQKATTGKPKECGTYTDVYEEARALYGPVTLLADVMVLRASAPYILSNYVPILLITLVVFVAFFLPCDALADRMTVVMTAFLSITALQFVFDFPPAVYLNCLQQLVLVSYVLFTFISLESLVVHKLITVARLRDNKRTCMTKYSELLARRPTRLGTSLARWTASRKAQRTSSELTPVSSGDMTPTGKKAYPPVSESRPVPPPYPYPYDCRPYRTSGDGAIGSEAGSPPYDRSAHHPQQHQPHVQYQAVHLQHQPPQPYPPQHPQLYPPPPQQPYPPPHAAATRHAPYPAGAAEAGDVGGSPESPRGAAAPPGRAPRAPAGGADAAAAPRTRELPAATVAPAASKASRGGVYSSFAFHTPPTNAASATAAAAAAAITSAAMAQGRSVTGPPAVPTSRNAGSALHTVSTDPLVSPFQLSSISQPYPPHGAPPSEPDGEAAAAGSAADDDCGGGRCGLRAARARRAVRACLAWPKKHCPGRVSYEKCKEDMEFALFLCKRIDAWSFWSLLVVYIILVLVLTIVSVEVGDHKLMMGQAPGNY